MTDASSRTDGALPAHSSITNATPTPRTGWAALPRIVVLTTGGTIAGAAASDSESLRYAAGALGGDALVGAVPALARIATIETIAVASIDSKDADPAFWCTLTAVVRATRARDDVDGIVITHGTDTLEETAYWLDLLLDDGKPIVLTAAMRPATALSADGPANLFDAVTLAGTCTAKGKGVLVTLQNRVHAARDVIKISSHALDAFVSLSGGPLGWVQDGRVGWLREAAEGHPADAATKIEPGAARAAALSDKVRTSTFIPTMLAAVEVVAQYAGASPRLVEALVAAGVRGIVVAGTGNGTINAPMMAALRRATAAGVVVVRSSRAADVRVTLNAAVDDEAAGFVASGSLNPYKARIRLMLALSVGVADLSTLRLFFSQA
ncbi:asparaginase [Robbsia andropogonis]|uniref:asparaginase n=1 Tax=Robbsia andropogonis TaxID=28092 RepID=UPI00209E6D6F|nr:asparaginase [Robbsia andropogonis]MCP1120954.1 asparaginase [Robbsia andropogonis]MCP1130765.1 asparaginase [Robbsia andropogonis]